MKIFKQKEIFSCGICILTFLTGVYAVSSLLSFAVDKLVSWQQKKNIEATFFKVSNELTAQVMGQYEYNGLDKSKTRIQFGQMKFAESEPVQLFPNTDVMCVVALKDASLDNDKRNINIGFARYINTGKGPVNFPYMKQHLARVGEGEWKSDDGVHFIYRNNNVSWDIPTP